MASPSQAVAAFRPVGENRLVADRSRRGGRHRGIVVAGPDDAPGPWRVEAVSWGRSPERPAEPLVAALDDRGLVRLGLDSCHHRDPTSASARWSIVPPAGPLANHADTHALREREQDFAPPLRVPTDRVSCLMSTRLADQGSPNPGSSTMEITTLPEPRDPALAHRQARGRAVRFGSDA